MAAVDSGRSTVIVMPLFHVHCLLVALVTSLASGAAVALHASGRFSASTFWSDMNQHKATWYTAVPTIHQIILNRHLSSPEPAYPKLRFIRSCNASLAPTTMSQLEETFGAPVLEAYAMTEAIHMMSSNPLPEDGLHKPGYVGKPVGQEMAVLDENGVVQGAGCSGEVCIRVPNVTKGYKNNLEANKVGFQFGWFHTGDLGYFDSDGYLHLVGRIKELINRGDLDDGCTDGSTATSSMANLEQHFSGGELSTEGGGRAIRGPGAKGPYPKGLGAAAAYDFWRRRHSVGFGEIQFISNVLSVIIRSSI